ncbi:MAG: hypothetical protein KAS67_02405 [Thermoplasmata archaeon]|nr:hypothetical protein [Thermoplasmata archaeon]
MSEEDTMIYLTLADDITEYMAILVMLTVILVGLTFAITAHLLFKMQAEIKSLRKSVQVETEIISDLKEPDQIATEPIDTPPPAPPQAPPAQPVTPQEPQTPPPAPPEAEMIELEEP